LQSLSAERRPIILRFGTGDSSNAPASIPEKRLNIETWAAAPGPLAALDRSNPDHREWELPSGWDRAEHHNPFQHRSLIDV
jgi:hypothetical protein